MLLGFILLVAGEGKVLTTAELLSNADMRSADHIGGELRVDAQLESGASFCDPNLGTDFPPEFIRSTCECSSIGADGSVTPGPCRENSYCDQCRPDFTTTQRTGTDWSRCSTVGDTSRCVTRNTASMLSCAMQYVNGVTKFVWIPDPGNLHASYYCSAEEQEMHETNLGLVQSAD